MCPIQLVLQNFALSEDGSSLGLAFFDLMCGSMPDPPRCSIGSSCIPDLFVGGITANPSLLVHISSYFLVDVDVDCLL